MEDSPSTLYLLTSIISQATIKKGSAVRCLELQNEALRSSECLKGSGAGKATSMCRSLPALFPFYQVLFIFPPFYKAWGNGVGGGGS